MNRILIYKYWDSAVDFQMNHLNSPGDAFDEVMRQNNQPINSGNKIWYQGIVSEIENENNEIRYRTKEMSPDYINSNFDRIVYPMANIFGTEHLDALAVLADEFSNIKVPTFVVACGAQAKSYDDLDDLICQIGENSKKFIKAIYNTGGEFALRGYFSKEFFTKLGFKSAVVTGCPSLFQIGREIDIVKNNLNFDQLKVCVNGDLKAYSSRIFYKNDINCFIDQDAYSKILYYNKMVNKIANSKIEKLKVIKNLSPEIMQLLLDDKVKYFFTPNMWRNFIMKNQFDFSYGARIHGNIIALLAGTPAFILGRDTRVQEMAEFFNIPYGKCKKKITMNDILSAYDKVDYTEFTKNFAGKFDAYEQFLSKCGIVDKLNVENKYFYDDSECLNKYLVSTLSHSANKIKKNFKLYSMVCNIYSEFTQ